METLEALGYPTWAIEHYADGGWEVLRREDGDTAWGHYGAFPSRADAIGFLEETIDFERRADRKAAWRAAHA